MVHCSPAKPLFRFGKNSKGPVGRLCQTKRNEYRRGREMAETCSGITYLTCITCVFVHESCQGLPKPLKTSNGTRRLSDRKSASLKVSSFPSSRIALVPEINFPNV